MLADLKLNELKARFALSDYLYSSVDDVDDGCVI